MSGAAPVPAETGALAGVDAAGLVQPDALHEATPTVGTAHAVLRTARAYGVDAVFGIPGTHSVEFYRRCADLGIRPVTTRHEQGAGYAADGWSARRGLPGVVITTAGPGLLNAMSAAATAYAESRPMIILSPGAPRGAEATDIGALHETRDPSGAMASIVVRSTRVHTGREAVELVHDAFALAATGHPRPVHIEIPLDVLEGPEQIPVTECAARVPAPSAAVDDRALDAAVRALRGAHAPVIIAGGGAVHAADALRRVAERLQAPVVTTLNGKATLPESHPLSLGANLRLQAVRDVCNAADVLLVVGSKVGEAELWGGVIDQPAVCVRVDIDPERLHTNLHADIAVCADSRAALARLADGLADVTRPPRDLLAVHTAADAEARATAPDLAALAETIAGVLPHGTVVAGDSSQITYLGMATFARQEHPRRFLYTPAYATLGYGLPAAIGAKIAAPDLPVVCVVGDGALMFCVQELMTAVEQHLDVTVVCVDNGGYREIRQNMLARQITPVGTDLAEPDWPALARAFGFHAVQADPSGAGDAVAAAVAVDGPSFVHVRLP